MEPNSLRQKLHQYVDQGDDKLLKLMYAVAKEYNEDDDFEYQFTEEEIKLFEERTTKRLSGESKTYSWKAAKEIITGKKKKTQRSGLGYEFIEEIEDGLERLSRHPQHYSATSQKYRKLRIKRFPYLIVFEIEDLKVIINSVRRISQEPKP